MMKAAIKREESQARLNFPKREQARPKVNDEGRKGSLKQKPKKHLIICQWATPYVLTLCLGV